MDDRESAYANRTEASMNKGSHILLANFLMNQSGTKVLNAYQRTFQAGCILPDCRPSFLTTRHTISETFDLLKDELEYLFRGTERNITIYYSIHLGILMHYLADYFTFPHNPGYQGGMKEHIQYEKELLLVLRKQTEQQTLQMTQGKLSSADEICDYILRQNMEYLTESPDYITDCRYIISVCHTVFDAVLYNRTEHQSKQTAQMEAA